MAPTVVFRCDASPKIGAGHVTRSLALAEEFERAGWRVVFATVRETPESVPALAAAGFRTELIEAEGEETNELARRFVAGVDLLVVDHYGRDLSFERACRRWARRILVLDDATGRNHDCDMLIDSAAVDPSIYAGQIPAHAKALTGPSFALVHRAFLDRRKSALASRDGRPIGNILLSFGATDPRNATSMVLDAFAAAGSDTPITIAMSSHAPHLDEVRSRLRPRMRLVLNADNMPELMEETDLAIGAAGATAYERAVLGLPTILVTLADNQRGICRLMSEAGAAVDGGELDADLSSRLPGLVAELFEDGAARARMAHAASTLVDGRGATRIMLAMIDDVEARDGASVNLRLAGPADEDWLLTLQRAAATRRYARNPEVPGADEHHRWMQRVLDDPDVQLLIVEADGVSAGMARLDLLAGEAPRFEVSIAIAPDHGRRGIASAVLKLIRQWKPGAVLDAEILAANTASLSLFERAGYVHVAGNLYRSAPAREASEAAG